MRRMDGVPTRNHAPVLRSLLLSGLAVLVLAAPSERPLVGRPVAVSEPITLRVVTYNIRHGEGRDGVIDVARQAEILASARPDLIALQEVDQGTDRVGGSFQLTELAGALGMHPAFGPTLDLPGGSYGVGVLSRWPLLGSEQHPLPRTADNEPRTALTVSLRVGDDGPLVELTSTHFDQNWEGDDRFAQARHLTEVLGSGDLPGILAGDFNARWDSDIMLELARVWVNPSDGDPVPPPDPRGRSRGRQDYILYRPAAAWHVVEVTVLDDRRASDHRPVLTVLEWRGGP